MEHKKSWEINIKNQTYNYDDDITNIQSFNSKNMKIDKKLSDNIFIYYIGYEISYGVKPLYLIFRKINGYVKDYDVNKYLTVVPIEKIIKNY